jgi:serine/threonine-protein kinase
VSNGGSNSAPEQGATPGPAPVDAWLGRTLDDRYRIDERLGAGGVGAVYRATQLKLQRAVAIKILQEGLHPSFTARFEREAKSLAALRHPNIVTVTDYGVQDGAPYIVMELIEGETLHYRLTRGAMSPEHVLELARQLLRALSFVHEQGVVHRDLKPGNVLLEKLPDDEERVRLLDFGLAKAMGGGPDSEGETVTRAGDILGTPSYMAPEQIVGDSIDARTDTYSFGIVLFQMLAGRCPFEGDPVELLRSHLVSPAPALGSKRTDFSVRPELEALIARALAKKREERFQSCAELLAALEAIPMPWLESRATKPPPSKANVKDGPAKPESESALLTTLHEEAELKTTLHQGSQPTDLAPPLVGKLHSHPAPAIAAPARRSRAPLVLWVVLLTGIAIAMVLIARKGGAPPAASELPPAAHEAQAPVAPEAAAGKRKPTHDVPPTVPKAQPTPSPAPSAELVAGAEPVPSAASTTLDIQALAVTAPSGPRAAARNPWARALPRALQGARKAALAGDRGSERTINALRRYNREHSDDPRGHLVLAAFFRNRNWRDDQINQYQTAYRRDPRARGAPEMLHDLVQLVAMGDAAGTAAAALIIEAYGSEALPALDRALSALQGDSAARDRWLELRSVVAR